MHFAEAVQLLELSSIVWSLALLHFGEAVQLLELSLIVSLLHFNEAVQVLLGMQFQDHACLAKLDVSFFYPA